MGILVKDSPLPNALDVFYSELLAICQISNAADGDKLVLLNTISSFDINEDTPFYNEGIFRRFIDRVFMSSPENHLGPANQADRFSVNYERLLNTVSDKVDQRHPEIVPKITELDRVIGRETSKLVELIKRLETAWGEVAEARGIKPDDPNYDLVQVKFMESISYSDQVEAVASRIRTLVIRKEQVRRSVYSASENLLLETVHELTESKKIARPLRPQFERTVPNVNELTFADPRKNPESICDVSLSAYPLGDLVKFLKDKGVREIVIDKNKTTANTHESSWKGSAGGSFSFCGIGIGGRGGGGGSKKIVENSSAIDGIHMAFANLDEVLVDRGPWYNPTLFVNEELARIFEGLPDLPRLRYASVSMVVGRGLTLTLSSSQGFDKQIWTKDNMAASGGVSLIGFSFGGGGGRNKSNYSLVVSDDGKSLKFQDDEQLTRVLAVRLTDCAIPKKAPEFLSAKQPANKLQSRFIDPVKLSMFRQGKLSYNDMFA